MSKKLNYIPLEECRDRQLYYIRSRNLSFGVFVKEQKGFVGIRTKFGHRYLFTEYHWDTGAPFGTVHPKQLLEECPIEDLAEGHVEGEDQADPRRRCFKTNQQLFEWLEVKEEEYAHLLEEGRGPRPSES